MLNSRKTTVLDVHMFFTHFYFFTVKQNLVSSFSKILIETKLIGLFIAQPAFLVARET